MLLRMTQNISKVHREENEIVYFRNLTLPCSQFFISLLELNFHFQYSSFSRTFLPFALLSRWCLFSHSGQASRGTLAFQGVWPDACLL